MSEMAAGKVCIGFSEPYVALYNNNAGTVTYTGGMKLARGVSVKVNPEVSDGDTFYADDVAAEVDEGVFVKGTVDLEVDGLHLAAERFILGVPEATEVTYGETKAQVTKFGKEQNAPYVGIGYIAKYRSNGNISWTPTVLTKAKFIDNGDEHQTAEGNDSNYQTQSLKANLVRDDSADQTWKLKLGDYSTKDEALTALKAVLGVTEAAG